MSVTKQQTVSLYVSHKSCPDTEDMDELNKALRELKAEFSVLLEVDDDGYSLVFKKE